MRLADTVDEKHTNGLPAAAAPTEGRRGEKMKRIFITMAAAAVLLVGCSRTHYPYLRYKNSDADGDSKDRWIEVRDGHELSEGHSWDIIETDQGYDLVLHFVKTEGVR